MAPTGILIAVPDYGGSIKTACFRSVLETFQLLNRLKIKAGLLTYNLSDIAISRNIMASIFLQNRAPFSHMLMIDSDMQFGQQTVAKLIAAEKPLIGCAYPRRELNLGLLGEAVKTKPLDEALAAAMTFTIEILDEPLAPDANGLARVAAIGMGLALIARGVFEDLVQTDRVSSVQPKQGTNLPPRIYGFFDREAELTEDFSFCRRWIRLCGGEVWCLLAEDIGHVGEFTYRAKLTDTLPSDLA